jgi:hypothetical protein
VDKDHLMQTDPPNEAAARAAAAAH